MRFQPTALRAAAEAQAVRRYRATSVIKIVSKHPKHPSYQDSISQYSGQEWRFVQLLIDDSAAAIIEYVLIFEPRIKGP
ncbi:MAG: hypothetical protein NZU74_20020 [Chloroflexaceae bacterium]|nr:hypothetical protein [Chloroflexaceae bacterium]